MLKTCKHCKEEKPLDEFYKHPRTADKRDHRCKVCASAYSKKKNKQPRMEGGPPSERVHQLRKYGLTPQTYEDLRIAQDYRCACCGIHQDDLTRRLSVDHCHTTGVVRGLLCQSCNMGIGKLGDTLAGVMRAVEYLK